MHAGLLCKNDRVRRHVMVNLLTVAGNPFGFQEFVFGGKVNEKVNPSGDKVLHEEIAPAHHSRFTTFFHEAPAISYDHAIWNENIYAGSQAIFIKRHNFDKLF